MTDTTRALLTLQGTTFTLAGSFASVQEDLQKRIIDAGGKVQLKLGARVDVVVAGQNPQEVVQRARYQGVPVIDEATLMRLLDGEAVERTFEPPEVFEEPALLSEVRGLLNTSADARVWPKLVRLLDRCAPSLMEVAVHYASAYLDRIDASAAGPLHVEHDRYKWARIPEDERLEGTQSWADELPWISRWRPAPLHWIGQLSQGARSPKLRLINALHLGGAKLSAGQVARALSCPDLTGVREISLGRRCHYGKVAFKALCDNPALADLSALSLDHDAPGMAHAGLLAERDALPSLKRLSLRHIAHVERDVPLLTLGCSPWAERIEALTLHVEPRGVPRVFEDRHLARRVARELTPNLRRALLSMRPPLTRSEHIEDRSWWPALQPVIGRAEVIGVDHSPYLLLRLSEELDGEGRLGELASATTLDLSHITLAFTRTRREDTTEAAVREVWQQLATCALTRHIGRVWLGSLHQRAAHYFDAAGIEVVTEPLPCLLT